MHFAAKPSGGDRSEVLSILQEACKALREGVATEHQWSIVAGSVAVAKAIERRGVVRGLHEHLDTAGVVLQNIYDRSLHLGNGRWSRVTLHYQELDAMLTFLDLHTFQVNQLGRAEFLSAIDAAHHAIKSHGDKVTLVKTSNHERLSA